MPYADPEKRRQYKRLYHQRRKNDFNYKKIRAKNDKNYQKRHPDKVKQWKRNYYNRYPDKKRIYQSKANKNRRIYILRLMGNKCVSCGNVDWRCLQVDHVNGGGAEHRRMFSNKYSVYKSSLLAEIKKNPELVGKKYQLLCANCHSIKSYEQKEFN